MQMTENSPLEHNLVQCVEPTLAHNLETGENCYLSSINSINLFTYLFDMCRNRNIKNDIVVLGAVSTEIISFSFSVPIHAINMSSQMEKKKHSREPPCCNSVSRYCHPLGEK